MRTVGTENGAKEPSRRFKFADAVLTDVGRKRNENQDAYGIAHSERVSLYVVADGMGGARGGAVASSIAVNVITKGAFTEQGEITPASLKTAIERANRVIFNRSKGDEELSGMGTTVVALAFAGESVLVAHVGDSRIYRLRGDSIEQLTRDHTLVQELVDTGAIPEEEAANHPIAHMLTRSLGPTEAVDVETHHFPDGVQAGDRFLLCSDGLYNLVSNDEIGEVLRQYEINEIARRLVDLALERGGTDNVTVEVLEACEVEDDQVPVAYPDSSLPEVTISQQVEVKNLDEMILAALREEGSEEATSGRAENGRSEDDLFDVPDDPYAETKRLEPLSEDDLADFDLDESMSQSGKPVSLAGRFRRGPLSLTVLIPAGLFALAYVFFSEEDDSFVGDARPSTALSAATPSTSPPSNPSVSKEQAQIVAQLNEWAERNREREVENAEQAPPPATPKPEPLDNFPQPSKRPSSGIEPDAKQILAIVGENRESAGEGPSFLSPESMTLPPPPEVKIRNEAVANVPADRPIIWEHEAEKIARIKARAAEPRTVAISEPVSAEQPESEIRLRPPDEVQELIAAKQGIRERVSDLDAKLKLLTFEEEQAVRTAKEALRAELAEIEKSIEQASASLADSRRLLDNWVELKEKSADTSYFRLAEEIAKYSEPVRASREVYAEASAKYLEAVDQWQENPNDLPAASRMGALGRDLQKRRVELEEAAAKAITVGVEATLAELIEKDLALRNLQLRREQLNRHIGYHLGFTLLSASRRQELKDSYLEERRSLGNELTNLQVKLPDEKEVELMQAASLEQYRPVFTE